MREREKEAEILRLRQSDRERQRQREEEKERENESEKKRQRERQREAERGREREGETAIINEYNSDDEYSSEERSTELLWHLYSMKKMICDHTRLLRSSCPPSCCKTHLGEVICSVS